MLTLRSFIATEDFIRVCIAPLSTRGFGGEFDSNHYPLCSEIISG